MKIKKEWDFDKAIEEFNKEHSLIISQFSSKTKAIILQLEPEERKVYFYRKLQHLMKNNPEAEYFTILIYYPYKLKNIETKKENSIFKELLISNKGRIYNLKTGKIIQGGENIGGYKTYYRDKYVMVIHRAVVSSWLVIPEKFNLYSYADLETNHLDGLVDNNHLTNLEWTTPAQNKLHAKENNLLINHKHLLHGLSIPMRGTVIDIPGFNKRVLYVCGKEECESIGVSNKVLYKIRTGVSKTYKGCSWEEVSKEEYIRNYKEYDSDLIEAIKNYNYDRNGRKSTRADKVIWELTHIKTKAMTRLSGAIELANFGTNYSDLNKSYKNNGKYKNYLIKKILPQTTQFPR